MLFRSTSEAARGTALHGANLVHTYSVHWWPVLRRQFASPLLLLLAATCLTAGFLGQSGNAFGDSSMQGVGSEPGVRALMQASAVSR